MYMVVLNSEIKSKSFSKTFTDYSRARDYANRLFHKRYTLSIREQGYPADDFIVFNKLIFSETEEIVVYNNYETFSLSLVKKKPVENKVKKLENSIKTNHKDRYNISIREDAFDRNIYSIKDHVDSIQIKQRLITEMLKHSPLCQRCGKPLMSRNNTIIRQIDKRIGYTRNNCFLKHRECRNNDIRTKIQFIDAE